MADGSDSDVLMYLIAKGSDPIQAESQSSLIPGDKLTADFQKGKFFEAEGFTFGIKLKDDEGARKKKTDETRSSGHFDDRRDPRKRGDDNRESAEDARSFARWRALSDDAVKPTPPFMAEPEDFSLTRVIDTSSPILLQQCLDVQRFVKAVVVKRSRLASSGALAGFLRMEFYQVYLKSIDWTDGDAVRETCKFKYAALNVSYVKRKADGTTMSSWPCEWESPLNG